MVWRGGPRLEENSGEQLKVKGRRQWLLESHEKKKNNGVRVIIRVQYYGR